MRVLRTTRRLPKEPVQWEAVTGADGQGMVAYADPVCVMANVVEYDAGKGEQYIVMPDGSRVMVPLTLYLDGDTCGVPDKGDRITMDGKPFIVEERKAVRGLRLQRGKNDHYRIRCRDE